MSKEEIKKLAKEISEEAISEIQIASSAIIIQKVEEIGNALQVTFEYYMDQFREFGVVQMEMRDNMILMKGDMGIMKDDIAVLKTDVAILKTDVAILKTDVSELKKDMKSVKNRLDVLEPKMHMLEIRDTETV